MFLSGGTAMEDEMFALCHNNTWESFRLPVGKTVVGCHGVFTVKYLPIFLMELLSAIKLALLQRATPKLIVLIIQRPFLPFPNLVLFRYLFI